MTDQEDIDAWQQQEECEKRRWFEQKESADRMMTENPDDNALDLKYVISERVYWDWLLDEDPEYQKWLEKMK